MSDTGGYLRHPGALPRDILSPQSRSSVDAVTSLVEQALNVPLARVILAGEGSDPAVGIRAAVSPDVCNLSVMPQDRRRVGLSAKGPGLRACGDARLTSSAGGHLGSLCLFDARPRQFSLRQRQIFEGLANVLSTLIELRALADVDFLTNVLNRRGFEAALKHEWARARRDGALLTLVIMDLDGLKRVNDRYGHAVGDGVLQAVAASVAGAIRRTDQLARIGGDEFAMLLTETSVAGAMEVAGRIHEAVAALQLCECPDLRPSLSIGVGSISTKDKDPLALLRNVDGAVYKAKRGGGNQTCALVDASPSCDRPEL